MVVSSKSCLSDTLLVPPSKSANWPQLNISCREELSFERDRSSSSLLCQIWATRFPAPRMRVYSFSSATLSYFSLEIESSRLLSREGVHRTVSLASTIGSIEIAITAIRVSLNVLYLCFLSFFLFFSFFRRQEIHGRLYRRTLVSRLSLPIVMRHCAF